MPAPESRLGTEPDMLLEMTGWGGSPVASVYFSSTREAVDPRENSLKLKSALNSLEGQLQDRGLRRPAVKAFLNPLNALLKDRDFWLHQEQGLALFRSSDSMRNFHLPYEVPHIVMVQDEPYLRYMFPMLNLRVSFYVLVLSKNRARLLHCTPLSVSEIDLDKLGVPTSLTSALRYDDLQKPELQHHPTTGPGRAPEGQAAPAGASQGRRHGFHGHGESGDDEKTQLRRYFQAIDDGVRKILPPSPPPPLVLAGVDYVQALYREVSKYHSIVPDAVTGSFDRLRAEQLHELALPTIEEQFDKQLADARERYGTAVGRGLASSDLAEVLGGAHDGRVDTLFVRWDAQIWGRYDTAERELATHDSSTASDLELLDLASRWTFANSGSVYVLQKDDMVVDEPLAAIFRY